MRKGETGSSPANLPPRGAQGHQDSLRVSAARREEFTSFGEVFVAGGVFFAMDSVRNAVFDENFDIGDEIFVIDGENFVVGVEVFVGGGEIFVVGHEWRWSAAEIFVVRGENFVVGGELLSMGGLSRPFVGREF
ncbi:MAG: hypothetical protein IT577_11185 [Verrucomicrobiae bacterium]|nr:hypothetical protein [Verrucomicrobiae bacterium]